MIVPSAWNFYAPLYFRKVATNRILVGGPAGGLPVWLACYRDLKLLCTTDSAWSLPLSSPYCRFAGSEAHFRGELQGRVSGSS